MLASLDDEAKLLSEDRPKSSWGGIARVSIRLRETRRESESNADGGGEGGFENVVSGCCLTSSQAGGSQRRKWLRGSARRRRYWPIPDEVKNSVLEGIQGMSKEAAWFYDRDLAAMGELVLEHSSGKRREVKEVLEACIEAFIRVVRVLHDVEGIEER